MSHVSMDSCGLNTDLVFLYDDGHISTVELLEKVEKDTLHLIMLKWKGNQVRACSSMNWSRGKLRSKLEYHFGNKYFRNLQD